MVNYVVKEKRQGNSRTILWIKTVDLPAKTGFSELFPELLKWDDKHPKQARYQLRYTWEYVIGVYYTQRKGKKQSKNEKL